MSRTRVGQIGADRLSRLFEGNVLVVVAGLGLGGRREDRLAAAWLAFFKPGGSSTPHTDCVCLVLLPAAAGEVAAHHGFDRQRLQALDEHRAAPHLRALVGCDHAFGVLAGEVVRHDVAQPRKPEQRHARQQLALAGDRLAHDHVEGRQAVAGHHQQPVVADGVVVAHLAARQQRQRAAVTDSSRCQRAIGADLYCSARRPRARFKPPSAPARPSHNAAPLASRPAA